MSDTDGKKTLGLRGGARPGNVKQSFSHGRTKNVVVETKRKRVVVPKTGAAKGGTSNPSLGDPAKRPAGITDAEMERRLKAVQAARSREVEEAAAREAEEKARAEDRERRRAEQEAKEQEEREREESLKAKAEEEERKAREAAAAAAQAAAAPAPTDVDQPQRAAPSRAAPQQDANAARKKDRDADQRTARNKGADDGRRSGKLTLNQALSGGEGGRQRSMAAMKRKQERARQKAMGGSVEREKVTRTVNLPEAIVVSELANRMAERVGDVVKSLMQMGMMVTQNQTIDADTAELIIEEFGHTVNRVSDADVEQVINEVEDKPEDLQARPPVITIMGHVDHGKTSLLDAIRNAKVVAGEAGGITQHIGAYQVMTDGGQLLTFLDTPGHAAFTSMRSRGAQVTDIVVLVVAADDAVMPQTVEAINHAKAAKVPMIVAINKIDKPGANPDKVRTDLLQHEVIVEKMSGEVQDVEVSALKGEGLDDLLEAIALQSELLELKANPNRAAQGAVIEAQLDVGRGPVATVLIQNGTLRQGDIFVVGEQYGKVRALINDKGERIKEAGPSVPVEVLGLNGTPEAGDVLNVTSTEAQAREIAEYREKAAKDKRAAAGAATTLEQLMANAKENENVSELPILVKADVQGSAEAIVQAMEKIGNDEVRVRVLHSGVGAITETDVGLAEASGAPIMGFNVRANASARNTANQKGVEIRYYSVIYDLVDDVKAAASGLLSNEIKENFIGYANIKEVFKVTGVGKVAGCLVTEGVARRSAGVRLLRDNVVIHEGTLKTLKRFKDEVSDVQSGQECGMAFENYDDIREGDVIEIFEREEVTRTLA
ncbi:translation initiation factor IF-2 [Sulfitobacter pseudonitzschiae]|uniref:Translation initiation factor IF-2 n=1 Tax=Pseudosulfitobacter pseudonitzschiae TaxID=1402135 RepID=A0A9Q2NK90_9RHOB|nr:MULTISPECIES: translation initiation factor IF-2 [Roseobacteraceae]MBM2290715.1 translation initiation factor IF-2 [Pseudosulfitobacter pseudonitzschiae]MBM2295633.1 translation initiation factor IF-2 [Pseudosulfitobacter pseudonitzschiae]MBM2300545.1 translation initiation factor IF-2 [Pseudosulfitobacter pseudonitzschiae]MBM2310330.1 translation initiation factor IF-2 [Pseudosulfitobacter pseudonitzschiae]MBM2315242.1 translation initiation factor IF-2 [Pseudosulfitobacter pseudonitzschia|tara:strand:- start:194510 stop:197002 length:2493 start_codon:yes stop_codon:yes gene_type:complete